MAEFPVFEVVAHTSHGTLKYELGTFSLLGLLGALEGTDGSLCGLYGAAALHPAAAVRASAAAKESLPPECVSQLAADPSPAVRQALVDNPLFRKAASREDILRVMDDPEVAAVIAADLDGFDDMTSEAVGEALLCHDDVLVRLRLAANTATPVRVLRKLCADPVPEVAAASMASLAARR